MPEYCVTGGTGLIGSNLVRVLLEKGHTVRATVRDPGSSSSSDDFTLSLSPLNCHSLSSSEDSAKVGFLLRIPGAAQRLKLLKADLTVPGSFAAAVSGADGVFHTAGPVLISNSDDIQAQILIQENQYSYLSSSFLSDRGHISFLGFLNRSLCKRRR